MQRIFGIYGYGFTRACRVGGFELVPFHTDRQTLGDVHRDPQVFRLTGYGKCSSPATAREIEDIHRLADVLSFCQQQWVVASGIACVGDGETTVNAKDQLPVEFDLMQRRQQYGEALKPDWLDASSRITFIEALWRKLADGEFLVRTGFDKAFYRSLEVLKLRVAYVDFTYYVYFSTIELLARVATGSVTRNAGQAVSQFLNGLGFTATQQDWERWYQLRNALYHRGELVGTFDGKPVGLDDLPLLHELLHDVLIKLTGFDDGTINWNRWQDHMSWSS